MNLDELQSVRDRERQTDKLQQLRASFYADAGAFIQQLREERDRVADRVDDPFDAPEINQLTDEINTAEQTVEAIYEKRVGKIVKAASFAAADLPSESDGMTAEEQELFETLVSDIKQNREHVLDVLSGDRNSESDASADDQSHMAAPDAVDSDTAGQTGSESTKTSEPPEPTDAPESNDGDRTHPAEISAADLMGETGSDSPQTADASDTHQETPIPESSSGGPSPSGESNSDSPSRPDPPVRNDGGQKTEASTAVSRTTVRITDDIETFVGFDDREYDLGENDIVRLPETNVGPLLERGVATQFE